MLETKQIWKLKFANPKLGMETKLYSWKQNNSLKTKLQPLNFKTSHLRTL